MLSVCIPVYNCNVQNLVTTLLNQLNKHNILYEIILIDDASQAEYRKENQKLAAGTVKYIPKKNNIGRSKIRNLFLHYAKYEYLLFLDCDSIIVHDAFIDRYLSAINKNTGIVCGGRTYGKKPENKKYLLRYTFGLKRECISAEQRNKAAYRSFFSNNFLIRKDIFQNHPFNEKIKGYGHEDTFFSYVLKRNNIPVKHIDNPVQHDFDESNKEFLQKTEQAVNNLIFISEHIADSDFYQYVKLLNTYFKLKKQGFERILRICAGLFLQPISFILIRTGRNLFLFDLYKLLYLSKQMCVNARGKSKGES